MVSLLTRGTGQLVAGGCAAIVVATTVLGAGVMTLLTTSRDPSATGEFGSALAVAALAVVGLGPVNAMPQTASIQITAVIIAGMAGVAGAALVATALARAVYADGGQAMAWSWLVRGSPAEPYADAEASCGQSTVLPSRTEPNTGEKAAVAGLRGVINLDTYSTGSFTDESAYSC